jgi:hypothetical protein
MAVDTKARVFLASKRERGEDPQKLSGAGERRTAGDPSAIAATRGEAVRGEGRTPTAAPPRSAGAAEIPPT